MKDTISKDKRRRNELIKKCEYDEGWRISLIHSRNLIKNIDREDLYLIRISIYSQFLSEMNTKGFKMKRYIQVWDTMINTVKSEETMKGAVRLLHQTNVQRNN
jgi:hypothetical protein